MSTVSSQIVSMQNQTAYNTSSSSSTTSSSSTDDSNMFLQLMLQQLQNQDPTEPTDNTEWLSQLAQYSSLEQMTTMNSNLEDCMSYISAIYNDIGVNSEITQTLSLIGKEVTIQDPDDASGSKKITGQISEASFEDGTGKIKVDGKYYSIANILSVRDTSVQE
jgi:flagellar basal-body rod modification protein FlgD